MLRELRRRVVDALIRPGGPAPEQRTPRSPGSVVDCAVYRRGERRGGPVHFADAARQAARRRDTFVWLGLHEPDMVTMRQVGRAFGLHELTVRQCVSGGHRPAVESIGEVRRIVVRTASYVEHTELTETSEVVDTGDVTVLVGERFAITVRHGAPGALRRVRAELEQRPDLLAEGPLAVAYAVTAAMVEKYLEVAGHVELDLERLEATAFGTDRSLGITQMYQLKREMVEFKRAVLPLREPFDRLLDAGDLPPGLRPWFADVRGDLARAVERVAGYDDLVSSILQARLAQVSVDQNNDMRKIASWAAIAAVQTAVAGLYGMNFPDMPLLDAPYGYWVVLAVMAGAGVLLHRRFKKAGWL